MSRIETLTREVLLAENRLLNARQAVSVAKNKLFDAEAAVKRAQEDFDYWKGLRDSGAPVATISPRPEASEPDPMVYDFIERQILDVGACYRLFDADGSRCRLGLTWDKAARHLHEHYGFTDGEIESILIFSGQKPIPIKPKEKK